MKIIEKLHIVFIRLRFLIKYRPDEYKVKMNNPWYGNFPRPMRKMSTQIDLNKKRTRQSRSTVVFKAWYVCRSRSKPLGCRSMKSKSFHVGLSFCRSSLFAWRLYVDPFRSYFSFICKCEGIKLFITVIRIFLFSP